MQILTHTLYKYTYMYMRVQLHTVYMYVHVPEFLISSYGTRLAQRALYFVLSFGQMAARLIMIILSLIIGSRYIPNSTHTNTSLAHASKRIKNSNMYTNRDAQLYTELKKIIFPNIEVLSYIYL